LGRVAAPASPAEGKESLAQPRGDLVAQRDRIGGRGGRGVAPEEAVRVGIDEFKGHPNLVAFLLEMPRQDVLDA